MNESKSTAKSIFQSESFIWLIVAIILVIGLIVLWGTLKALAVFWSGFVALDKTIAAALVAGFFTVIATTITVLVGRYYEEKRKKAELHRERKIEMYDEFIGRMFMIFGGEEYKRKLEQSGDKTNNIDLTIFLRDKQKQIMLWSNARVVRAFSEWQKALIVEPNAQSLITTEKLFLAIRNDLGHSNWGIKQGDTIRNLLRNTDFFLEVIKTKPNITLNELAKLEVEAGIGDEKGT